MVISEEYGRGRSALEIAEAAIKGGVDIIQMREKNKGCPESIDLGKRLSAFCRESKVIFIVNDDPMIAKEADADGVHLGQEDSNIYPIDAARKILGGDKIIGLSTHSLDTFKKANKEDVDYIAFGPVFPTEIKDRCVGTEDVKKILDMALKPVFFIGGIGLANVNELLDKGAKNIALIRDVLMADDITGRTRAIKKKLLERKGAQDG